MDGILDGKPGMTIDELIALLEKGPIKAESNNVECPSKNGVSFNKYSEKEIF